MNTFLQFFQAGAGLCMGIFGALILLIVVFYIFQIIFAGLLFIIIGIPTLVSEMVMNVYTNLRKR